MDNTIQQLTAVFESLHQALGAVEDLFASGFGSDDIQLVASEDDPFTGTSGVRSGRHDIQVTAAPGERRHAIARMVLERNGGTIAGVDV
jgi:hypothetical protein